MIGSHELPALAGLISPTAMRLQAAIHLDTAKHSPDADVRLRNARDAAGLLLAAWLIESGDADLRGYAPALDLFWRGENPRAEHKAVMPCASGVIAFLGRQFGWQSQAFGDGPRLRGLLDHIGKELKEIEAANGEDIEEWIDLVFLALDGARRAGASPAQVFSAWAAKLNKNEKREWPDWRTADPSKAIEHVRA